MHRSVLAVALLALAGAPGPHAQAPVAMPAIPGVVAAGSPAVFLKGGMTSSEGPIAAPDGSVYFSEPTVNKIYRVDPSDAVTVLYDAHHVDDPAGERWRLPALAMNSKGTIFACRRAGSKIGIAIVYPTDQAKFIAESYRGTGFGAPNDLSMARDGGIYFTDPGTQEQGAQRAHFIYYVKPSGDVVLATDQIGRPNGLVLSPDEKTLYAVDSQSEFVFAFDVHADGTLAHRRDFAKLQGVKKTERGLNNGIDGMAIDSEGRVYAISNAGVEVFTAKGEALGIIPVPVKAQNLAFGGPDGKTLYIVGHGNLYKVRMLAQRFAGRAK
ncbi:MAG: SMP-30/gluconolactonase/LRE family protein [Acidobacteriota bacterium]